MGVQGVDQDACPSPQDGGCKGGTIPMSRYPCLSCSKHHGECIDKVVLDLIKLCAARAVSYLWPAIPVCHVVSTMENV